jgi:hypothetical protein
VEIYTRAFLGPGKPGQEKHLCDISTQKHTRAVFLLYMALTELIHDLLKSFFLKFLQILNKDFLPSEVQVKSCCLQTPA